MTKISKNLRAADQKISRLQTYDPESAVKLMIATAATKFDATAEIHFHLGIEPKHADQQIRSTFSLPHGIGKKIRVVAILRRRPVGCRQKSRRRASGRGRTH